MAKAETHLAALDAAEVVRRGALDSRRQELTAVLDGLVRLSRRPAAALLASQSAPIDAYRGARLMSSVIPALDAEAAGLRAELQDLLRLRDDIAAEQATLDRARAAAAGERDGLERLLAEKAAAQSRYRAERAAEEKRVAALGEEAKDLRGLVRRLAEEETRRQAEEAARLKREEEARLKREEEARRRLEAEARRSGEAAAREEARRQAEEAARLKREEEAERTRVAALTPPKGASPAPPASAGMPVLGRVVESFGQSDRFGQPSRGLRLETRAGAQVVAPQDGRIVFAGPFRDYGLLLILAHGDGYHTLLSGMSRLHGAVGQQVLAGEPVGQMGGADAGPPTLYVELRRGGEPINPTPWLAAGKGKVSG